MGEANDSLQVLIIEDDDVSLKSCRDRLEIYVLRGNPRVNLIESTCTEDASEKIGREDYDGVIVDLKLPDYVGGVVHEDGGERVIDLIDKQCLRIPVAIMTGTPRKDISLSLPRVKYFIKGEVLYDDIFDWFDRVNKTGLTKIFGRSGQIEDALNAVYSNSLWPQLSVWLGYAQSTIPDAGKRTEKALLRLVLDHVIEMLEDDNKACYPEEVYIFPPSKLELRTGSIVRKKDDESLHIVLNPACDLVMREHTDGAGAKTKSCNTDMILLARIDQKRWYDAVKLKDFTTEDEQISYLKHSLEKWKGKLHVHWLPSTSFFGGGLINFRKLSSVNIAEFQKEYETPRFQISPPFIKDVQACFSSYYGRQGQPEIACEKMFRDIILSPSKEHEDQ